MVSFSALDIIIILSFFAIVLLTGFLAGKSKKDTENYLLSGRKVGLTLFILSNVATWYGGILGVGEFTYRYGLVSWLTQGLPYYIFAVLFAVFFAGKIRTASLFTIPDKLEQTYGRKVGIISAFLIFILVSPAPYVLMVGSMISLIFNIQLLPSLAIAVFISVIYLFPGGYKSDLYTDAFQFFVMFAGFIIIVVVSYTTLGGFDFLKSNLPESHLSITGNTSSIYILVWFLIALWTFTDPGFHQRCYAAKSATVASKGILISVIFWILFDFLTTSTGLYARADLPALENPVLAFPLFAERVLASGLKGIFYAALFATIISTLNTFLFISATTFGRDFVFKIKRGAVEKKIADYTKLGLLIASILSILLAFFIDSVIELWYTIGSLCIPGIILLIMSAYYPKFKISNKAALIEIVSATSASIIWLMLRTIFSGLPLFDVIEPMIVGMAAALLVHFLFFKKFV